MNAKESSVSEAGKMFRVFGESVEVLVASENTRGSFSMIVQTSPPGGGPPPHRHKNEDEIFRVLEGEYELFDGKEWRKVPHDRHVYMLRGSTHTFRNCGTILGRMECIVVPGGLELYLEALSAFSMPQDAERVTEVSLEYGISFVTDLDKSVTPV